MTSITKRDRRPLFLKTAFSPCPSDVPALCDVFKWSLRLSGADSFNDRKDREGKETMGQIVTVLALFKAKPGLEEEVRRELMALQGPTRSEEGCINYDLHRSKDDPSRFMFYENWKSQEDLDQHLQMPYLTAFREKAGELLAEPASITLHEMIGD